MNGEAFDRCGEREDRSMGDWVILYIHVIMISGMHSIDLTVSQTRFTTWLRRVPKIGPLGLNLGLQ